MNDLATWLDALGLAQHAATFARNDVDFAVLPHLSDDDLKELGLSLGHRRKLLAAIAALDQQRDTAPAGERRQVTILFADLTGFTRLTGSLDAEETHALLNRYFDAVDGVITSFGGHIDKHIGDAVMAIFGAPVAHSNDPERAVRAALDVHRAVAGLEPPLQAHIGIASGQVVASGTGSDEHREYTVIGDSVNLASRLTDRAGADETLLSDAVARGLEALLDAQAMPAVRIDGFAEPLTVWRLRGVRDAADRSRTTFAGRQRELAQLTDTLDTCAARGNGQLVYLRGEAGMGKSRLVAEFRDLARERGIATHTGLALDFGVGKGQDAIRTIAGSLLNLAATSAEEARRHAAQEAVSGSLVAAADAAHLNDLLDLPQPPELHALYDAMDNAARNAGKQRALATLIERRAERQPLVLCVEDIHWADTTVLADLAALATVAAACPVVLVLTSRIEGDPLDARWNAAAGDPAPLSIDLAPLGNEAAHDVAAHYGSVDRDIVERCIERAAGNPFFLEQLLQSAEAASGETVPGSVQSIVQARVDALAPGDKAALQAAAVMGQRFALAPLRFLIDDDGYCCDGLEARQLVRAEGENYLFAHALVRDGVYGSLLRDQRRALHRRAADWFAARDIGLKAEHLDRAEDPGAATAYLEAAENQAQSYRFERALHLADRGIELAGDDTARAELVCLRGDMLRQLGQAERSIEAFEKARGLTVDGTGRTRAEIGVAAGLRMVDRYDDALAALTRAQAEADPSAARQLAEIHHLRGNLYFPLGNIDGCLRQHEQALSYAQKAGSAELQARALGGLGDAYYARGHMATAYRHFDQCIKLCGQHGLGQVDVANRHMRGSTRQYHLDLTGALADGREAADRAARVGNYRAEIVARGGCLGWVLWDRGDFDAAGEQLEQALALARRHGARRFESFSLSFAAKIAVRRGERDEAARLAEQSVAVSRETGLTFTGPMSLGALALAADTAKVRDDALREAEQILTDGCVSHNYLWFYRDAIEVCLNAGLWAEATRYADALARFTASEPLPWSDFFIARGRALAACGKGARDERTSDELRGLRKQAEAAGLMVAIPAIDAALNASAP